MSPVLADKIAIVTGAAQGIGRAIALAYAREGAHLVLADLNQGGAQAVAEAVRAAGQQALAVPCDVSDPEQVAALVAQAVDAFERIDVLVNNAGIQIRAPVTEMRLEDWDRTLAVNLRGCFLCTRAVLPHMLRQGSGHIVNVSSDSGKHGWPTGSAYCASKFGILGFTEAVAAEVMRAGVHVNAICPGGVITPMSDRKDADGKPKDRSDYMQPEDVAEVAVFLASDAARAFYGAALDAWGLAR